MRQWKHTTGLFVIWLCFSICSILFLFQFVLNHGKVKVAVDYTAYKKEDISIYWDNGKGWAEENSITKTARAGRRTYTFSIRHADTITSVRIDPDEKSDSVILHSVTVNGILIPFTCSDFSNKKYYNAHVLQQSDGLKIFRDKDSDDPNLEVLLPDGSGTVLHDWKINEIIIIIITFLIDVLILIFSIRKKFLKKIINKQSISKMFFVFAFLLGISMCWTNKLFYYYPKQPNIENRELVKLPKWNLLPNLCDSFFKTTTQWCSDHFYYRNMLIGARSSFILRIFNETPMRDIVLVGNGNMMFPAFEPFLKDFTGVLPYSHKHLDAICADTKEKYDLLSADSIQFWLVVVPSKQTVYYDLMPDYYRLQQHRPTFLDLVADTLTKEKVGFISLSDTLLNLRLKYPDRRLFYDYDTHWNEFGAFKCYQVMMNAIRSKDSTFMPPLNDDEIRIDTIVDNEADLAKCLVVNNKYLRMKYSIKPIVKDTISTEKVIEKKQVPTIIYHNPRGHGRILFYRDSYTIQWAPFFAHNFRDCILVYTHSMKMDEIKKYKPDIVIEEVGEFFIGHLMTPIKK